MRSFFSCIRKQIGVHRFGRVNPSEIWRKILVSPIRRRSCWLLREAKEAILGGGVSTANHGDRANREIDGKEERKDSGGDLLADCS